MVCRVVVVMHLFMSVMSMMMVLDLMQCMCSLEHLNPDQFLETAPVLLDIDQKAIFFIVNDTTAVLNRVVPFVSLKLVDGYGEVLDALLVDILVKLVQFTVDDTDLVGHLQLEKVRLVVI